MKIVAKVNEVVMYSLWILVLCVGTVLDSDGFTALKIEAVLVLLLVISSIFYHLTRKENYV